MARGDTFKNTIVAKILKALHLIPIYRMSEGRSNLSKNNETFKTCITLLKENETILIFSEGLCINEWQLRPLKKGTARLALMAYENGIENIKIQPTTINYHSFKEVPKQLEIHYNREFEITSFLSENEAIFYKNFNERLKQGIEKNIKTENHFINKRTKKYIFLKITLSIPAFLGYCSQKWFYNSIKKIAFKKTKNTVFYDSVLFGLLLITYPIFILVIALFLGLTFGIKMGMLSFILLPLLGYSYKKYKTI